MMAIAVLILCGWLLNFSAAAFFVVGQDADLEKRERAQMNLHGLLRNILAAACWFTAGLLW